MTLSVTNFVYDATSLFEIWTPPVPVAFTEGFFLFLIEWYSFFFFTMEILLPLIFPWEEIFPQAESFHMWILSGARCK